MKKKIILGILFLVISVNIFADGIIIPIRIKPYYPRRSNPIAVTYHNVNISFKNAVANVTIDQEFFNDFGRRVEAKYIFPVPKGAAVTDFKMIIGDKVYKPKIYSKEEARKKFLDYVRRNKKPALLEYADLNLLEMRVADFAPYEKRRVEIKYTQALTKENNVYKFTYPYKIESLAKGPLGSAEICMNIESVEKIKDVYSPFYKIKVDKVSENNFKVKYADKKIKPNYDFTVFITTGKRDLDLSFLASKSDDKQGYFMLTLAPDIFKKGDDVQPKNVICVMDTSGSMYGRKIRQAKKALEFVLNNLNKDDKFNIIRFHSFTDKFSKKLVGTDKVKKALAYVDDIEATGGTNINEALISALKILEGYKGENNFILFVTDGVPTAGVTQIRKIISNITKKNKTGKDILSRIFVFGVGYDVNTRLLDTISEENAGKVSYVIKKESIEAEISKLYNIINSPFLSNIKIDFDNVKVTGVHPKYIYNIFKGTEIRIFGRYKGSGKADITLTGCKGKEKVKYGYFVKFPEKNDDNFFIPKLWANRRIADLITQVRIYGENKEIVKEIKKLSQEFGIITKYTSFLLGAENERIATRRYWRRYRYKGTRRGTNLYNHGKLDESEDSSFGGSYSGYAKSKKKESLKDKVIASKEIAENRTSTIVKDTKNKISILGKTFFKKKDFYIDTLFKNNKTIKIKAYSNAYYELLLKYKKLIKYLSIGEKIKIRIKKYNIIIDDNKGITSKSELFKLLK